MNRQAFFDSARASFRTLSQDQVDGCNAILDAWDRSGLGDIRWLAYMLATTYHETAGTMQPIKEYGGKSYFKRMYDIKGDRPYKARELGNLTPGDGARFCGRGYVQLTGRTNYARATEVCGADFIKTPALAMRPAYAAQIMFSGMTEGWFTGKKLSHYINGKNCDYWNARRIINGTDKASLIERYALTFEKALKAAGAKVAHKAPRTAEKVGGGVGAGGAVIAAERASQGDWWGVLAAIVGFAIIGFIAYQVIKRKQS